MQIAGLLHDSVVFISSLAKYLDPNPAHSGCCGGGFRQKRRFLEFVFSAGVHEALSGVSCEGLRWVLAPLSLFRDQQPGPTGSDSGTGTGAGAWSTLPTTSVESNGSELVSPDIELSTVSCSNI